MMREHSLSNCANTHLTATQFKRQESDGEKHKYNNNNNNINDFDQLVLQLLPIHPGSQTHSPETHSCFPPQSSGHSGTVQSSPLHRGSQAHTPFV
jgi:hypothetical protein